MLSLLMEHSVTARSQTFICSSVCRTTSPCPCTRSRSPLCPYCIQMDNCRNLPGRKGGIILFCRILGEVMFNNPKRLVIRLTFLAMCALAVGAFAVLPAFTRPSYNTDRWYLKFPEDACASHRIFLL